ncbi:MAG: CehA/McbA family metallohydrolase [Planctomycetota bacterium]
MQTKVTLRLGVLFVCASSAAAQIPRQNACGVTYTSGTPCPPGFVVPPVGWHGGDSHEHIQQCFNPLDVTPSELYTEMQLENTDVLNALIWGAGFITPDTFLSYTSQFVTGSEDPITVADPTKILQFGIETSGVSCGNLGHMIGLNITNTGSDIFQFGLGCTPIYPDPGWNNDGSGDFSQPILDLFRQQVKAVTGYAHQSWPVDLYADLYDGGWDWEDPLLPSYVGEDAKCSFGQDMAFPVPKTCGNTHPVLAPFDVALGRVDFIEAFEMLEATCGDNLNKRYFGMFYRLLNTGQQVALSAGTDADCIGHACNPRAWVKLENGASFTYDNWTKALKLGRSSISHGPHQFLEMTVDNQDIGDTLQLSSPAAMVNVKATYHLDLQDATQVTDTIEIVQNGTVVASESFGPMGTGTHTFEIDVPVLESGWIAARTASYSTHTSAVMTLLDGKPVATCEDGDYWALYADFLQWNLDLAAFVSAEALEFYVGCSETEIREYINRGRKIYAAIRDYAQPDPFGTQRFGTSSPPSCGPPPGIVTDDVPILGQPFTLRYFNAPPSSVGGLLVSTVPLPVGIPVLGASLHLLINPALDPVSTISNEGGYGETTIPSMPPPTGLPLHLQYVWFNPAGCNQFGLLSSSDAMTVTVQP